MEINQISNEQEVNINYKPLFLGDKRYYILLGGRSAGRSYTASQYIKMKLFGHDYFRCAIMRFVLGDIRNSIFQEIVDRLEEAGQDELVEIRPNFLTVNYGKNKINGIGFRKSSGDQKSKLKSLASYTDVVIEEADEVSEEDFMQLDDSLRTIKSPIRIILLLNAPPKNHWIIKRWFNLIPSEVEGFYIPVLKSSEEHNTCFVHTTFKENIHNLNQSTINNFNNYKINRPDHFYNMIMGLVSEGQRGRIFKNWKTITTEEYEKLEYPEEYGLDFGFTNDPTALTGIKTHNEKVYSRELIYKTGLTNQDISDEMERLGISKDALIYADNAEPKSIRELQILGWNVQPAEKGADSITAGIDMLLSREVFYTEDSLNIAIESQEYRWALNREKEPTNKPIDKFNHAMDSMRYYVFTSQNQPFVGVV